MKRYSKVNKKDEKRNLVVLVQNYLKCLVLAEMSEKYIMENNLYTVCT